MNSRAERERLEIEAQVAQYLSNGGEIEKVCHTVMRKDKPTKRQTTIGNQAMLGNKRGN